MTRTELLSLAERLPMHGFGDDCQADVNEAAALLRKLAELRPVAWIVEFGAVSLPAGHPSRITAMHAHQTQQEAEDDDCEFDRRIFSVYQLSEVLTDE